MKLCRNIHRCIQGYYYDATVSKMAANKIEKLSMVSDFNENWYLRYFEVRNWLVPWILIWGSFGDFCFCIQTRSNLVIIIIIILPLLLIAVNLSDQILREWWFGLYPTSQESGSPSQEVHSGLGIFNMTTVAMETVNPCQIFDLTYIGNHQRNFHKALHIY